jgi:CRP-like cAMP-binding protein
LPELLTNRLLQSLSPGARKALDQRLIAVPLPVRFPLFSPGEVPRHLYFLTSGIASVVTDMEDGSVVEVAILGREAMPGSLLLLGSQPLPTRCFMQLGGTGLRIGRKEFAREFHSNPELRARLLQQVQYEALTLGRLSACNRLHEVEERLARWLLMVSDRIESDVLKVTHEFLGQMLGTRRTTVTTTVGTLQKAGLIVAGRGTVQILDRGRLVEKACLCYIAMQRFHRDLYAAPVDHQ